MPFRPQPVPDDGGGGGGEGGDGGVVVAPGDVLHGPDDPPPVELGDIGDFYLVDGGNDLYGPKYLDTSANTHGRLTTPDPPTNPTGQYSAATGGQRVRTLLGISVVEIGFAFGQVTDQEVSMAVLDENEVLIAQTAWVIPSPSGFFTNVPFDAPVDLVGDTEYIFAWASRDSVTEVPQEIQVVGAGSSTAGWDGSALADTTYTTSRTERGVTTPFVFNVSPYSPYYGAFRVITEGGVEAWPETPRQLMAGWPAFISDTPPVTTSLKYIWIDTSVEPPVMNVEDGTV